MRTIITKRRTVTLIISMLAMFVLAACGGENAEPAAVDTATAVPPTPTQVVIEVTAAPIPTETPVPTATVEPTPEPTADLTDELAAKFVSDTKAGAMVDFPSELTKGSERIDDDQVLAHWEDFISGTRSFAFSEGLIIEWCSGGEGTWVYEVGTPAFTGAKFDYELRSDPGSSWNSIVVIVKMREKKLFDLMNYAGGDGFRIGLAAPKPGDPSGYHTSPDCT
ncbi:MAG: hypothetical protein V3T49_01570 [Dehalococcoidia bacterium]